MRIDQDYWDLSFDYGADVSEREYQHLDGDEDFSSVLFIGGHIHTMTSIIDKCAHKKRNVFNMWQNMDNEMMLVCYSLRILSQDTLSGLLCAILLFICHPLEASSVSGGVLCIEII